MSDKKAVYNKTYYTKHKEAIIKHLEQKVLCVVCDHEYSLSHLSRHRKSNKHKLNSERGLKN